MDIFNMILHGSDYVVNPDARDPFSKYIDENKDEYHLLVSNWSLMKKISIERLLSTYYIHELFEIGNCYLGSLNMPFTYWHISKDRPEIVKTSVYHGSSHPYRDDEVTALRTSDKYKNEYMEYLSKLNQWVMDDEKPSDEKLKCEFNIISGIEFDITKPYARYYRKNNDKLRKLLINEEIVPLSEFATIARASVEDINSIEMNAKTLAPNKLPSYPYVPEMEAIDYVKSTEKIHKGDIIKVKNDFFLVDKESDFDLYAPPGRTIIRAKGICPEYLYLYLSSNVAKKILREFRIPTGDYSYTDLAGSIEQFPVIKPKEKMEDYIEKFKKIASPGIRYYIEEKEEKPSSIEQVLKKEIVKKIEINSDNLVKKQIDEDIAELNTCFENKAYKATLILAGSIMEAILIDWLSALNHVNYFEKTLMKREYDKKNHCYKTDEDGNYIYIEGTSANLADYIDEIRDIKRPEWMDEAKGAHKIRKKRNLVHAKLCLKENVQIDAKLCDEVIGYLKKIIESRWN